MTTDDRFDRQLEAWLQAEATATRSDDMHAGAIELARRSRQRPGWLVTARGGGFGSSIRSIGVPQVRLGYVVAILGLIVLLIGAVIAAGRIRPAPIQLGRNGAIVYELRDIGGRPYNHGHLIQPDGTGDRVVAQATCPTFSLDGTALSYTTGWDTTAQVAIARGDGSDPIVMPGVDGSAYAMSPDGARVAWFKTLSPITSPVSPGGSVGVKNELWVTPVSGGPGARIVDAAPAPLQWFSNPVWSPDGSRIAYAVNLTVFNTDNGGFYRVAIDVVNADGSNPHRLTSRVGSDEIGISWSPNSRLVSFVGIPEGSPLPSLAAGGGPPTSFYPPLDVFVIGADGTGERNITKSGANDVYPSWSPDGAYLANLSYAAGDPTPGYRLETIPMDGPDPAGPPTIGPASEYVVWSPDGTKLLWLTEDISDPSTTGPQAFLTRMGVIDRQFLLPASTLLTVDHGIGCVPSWQRLEP